MRALSVQVNPSQLPKADTMGLSSPSIDVQSTSVLLQVHNSTKVYTESCTGITGQSRQYQADPSSNSQLQRLRLRSLGLAERLRLRPAGGGEALPFGEPTGLSRRGERLLGGLSSRRLGGLQSHGRHD